MVAKEGRKDESGVEWSGEERKGERIMYVLWQRGLSEPPVRKNSLCFA